MVVVALVLAVSVLRAKSALSAAVAEAQLLQEQLTASEAESSKSTLASLQADTERSRDRTDGLLWSAAAHLPVVGDDFRAVRTVAASIDGIADKALPPVVSITASLNAKAFSPKDGRIDLAAMERIRPAVTDSSSALSAEAATIAAIDPNPLFGPLESQVRDLQTKVAKAAGGARAAATATELAPALLGAQGERSYLVIFQNNAEIRSTGGLTGAFVIMHAEDGAISIDSPGASPDLMKKVDQPPLKLTDDELLVYPSDMGTDIRDTNFTPDFPRVGQLDRAIVKRELNRDVDGVLSMDPVGLSYVLRGTGPVTLADGTVLTADNAIQTLLNETYRKIEDNARQDAFFAGAAERIFATVASGAGDPRETLRALSQGVAERRVMFWSADEAEQSRLAGTALAHELPARTKAPQFGVYLNDATLAKMQYYLDFRTKVSSVNCSSDGVQTLISTTTLTSTAPANARSLPKYVTGPADKAERGEQVLIVRFYGTGGGAFTEVTLDDKEQQLYDMEHHGRPVTYLVVTLKPGQEAEVQTTSITGRGQHTDGLLLTTPGIKPSPNAVPIRSSC